MSVERIALACNAACEPAMPSGLGHNTVSVSEDMADLQICPRNRTGEESTVDGRLAESSGDTTRAASCTWRPLERTLVAEGISAGVGDGRAGQAVVRVHSMRRRFGSSVDLAPQKRPASRLGGLPVDGCQMVALLEIAGVGSWRRGWGWATMAL
jgi:hypothetical protein